MFHFKKIIVMKAGLILTLVLAVVIGSASAQGIQRTKRVTQAEVPVTIVQSLEKDFNITDPGNWKVQYRQNVNSSIAVQYYIFAGENQGKKVEIFYKPDGTVDHAKGIEVPDALTSKR